MKLLGKGVLIFTLPFSFFFSNNFLFYRTVEQSYNTVEGLSKKKKKRFLSLNVSSRKFYSKYDGRSHFLKKQHFTHEKQVEKKGITVKATIVHDYGDFHLEH